MDDRIPVDPTAVENGPKYDMNDASIRQNEEVVTPVIEKGNIDPIYESKAVLLNHAVQEIGMGTYQWKLFMVVGFGWASDNLWPIVTSLILPEVVLEFKPKHGPFLTLAQNIGLLVGAMFWGFGCDVFGRKWAFNLTIGITAVFGMIAASSPNFAAIGCFAALWSTGVGGNLPVDSAIFLEFLPGSHQYLLTVLSVFWALAQIFATLVAWPLLGNLSCQETDTNCRRSDNMGWRYFLITMGGVWLVLFVIRFMFPLFESPKYLMGRGRDAAAIKVVHEVAIRNGKISNITVDELESFNDEGTQHTSAAAAIRRRLHKVNFTHVRAVFATPKLAFSTSIMMLVWGFIGLAYPLYNAFIPYIQAQKGAIFGDGSTYITYRNTLIIATMGVPGALIGAALVELPRIGRKGALSASTALTGVFLYVSTTASSSNQLLGWNCAFNLFSSMMYAVLYGFTPEIFPTKDRGTGNALTATANRIFGIMAPIIATYADLSTSVPVYVSGALFIVAGLMVLVLPFESRGKVSL